MARRQRISAPPPLTGGASDIWFNQVTDALNFFPNFSIISTSAGPESNVTGDPGTIAFDIGSGVTRWYGKYTGSSTTGWVPLAIINTSGTGGAYSSAFSWTEFF